MNLIRDKRLTTLVEFFQKLIDGETIIINENFYKLKDNELMYLSPTNNDFERSTISVNFIIDCDDVYATKTPEWYDNIPEQGILCEAWDDNSDIKYFRIIKKYHSSQRRKFVDINGLEWHNAVPVTLDDIKELIYDPNS